MINSPNLVRYFDYGNIIDVSSIYELCHDCNNFEIGTNQSINQSINQNICVISGFIKLLTLLIKKGATTALLNSQGTLFTCPEFEGAQVEIEKYRLEHTFQVMSLIEDKSKRAFEKLKAIWVVCRVYFYFPLLPFNNLTFLYPHKTNIFWGILKSASLSMCLWVCLCMKC